jgi:hypothetical protein
LHDKHEHDLNAQDLGKETKSREKSLSHREGMSLTVDQDRRDPVEQVRVLDGIEDLGESQSGQAQNEAEGRDEEEVQKEAYGLARLGVRGLIVVQYGESYVQSVQNDKVEQENGEQAMVSVRLFWLAVVFRSSKEQLGRSLTVASCGPVLTVGSRTESKWWTEQRPRICLHRRST